MSGAFDHFDALAPFYDRVIPFSRLEKMLNLLGLPAPALLLDAGGGTGRVSAALQPYLQKVILADVSGGMLAQARAKALNAVQAPCERLPFEDNFFDRILMVDALHHVFNQAETLSELFRVLKPGGRLLIEEPDLRAASTRLIALAEKMALMRSHFLSPEQIIALLPRQAKISLEARDGNAWLLIWK